MRCNGQQWAANCPFVSLQTARHCMHRFGMKSERRGASYPKVLCRSSVEPSPATRQRIGVLGGGQLGKMLGLEAARMGIDLRVLDPTEDCPAASVAGHVVGDFSDAETVRSFVTDEDVLTVEIEHVDAAAMRQVRESCGIDVEPTPETLEIIQDKFEQKEHFNHKAGLKVTSYIDVSGEGTSDLAGMVLGLPFMLKAKRLAYDGRGNAVVNKLAELEEKVELLGGYQQGLYGEKWVQYTKEVAVMVAKAKDGSILSFPVTETVHKESILHVTQTPAQIPEELQAKAKEMAEQAVSSLGGAGIFGVEMFVMEGGELALNEVAPRPHNSGHYSIEACATSQFEQHLRAISGLPLGDPSLKVNNSIMLNILGEAEGEEGQKAAQALLEKGYATPGASVHWYGKKGVSPKRKIGHITIVADSPEEAVEKLAKINPSAAESLQRTATAFEEDWQKVLKAREEGDDDEKKKGAEGPPVLALSVEPQVKNSQEAASLSGSSFRCTASASEDQSSTSGAEVAIIMGSDSDLPTMQAAADVLQEFGVKHEVTIVSAHRTPDRMLSFARKAHQRGVKVIIAGAGGAAHLPGMVASLTPLPVVGVPVTPKGAHLDGLDALMSIVQMPKGVPVATVAIGNAANAGLLAARILAASNPRLLQKMVSYQESMRDTVLAKAERLESQSR